MVNGSLGTMGRAASKMVVRALGGPDFNSCLMTAALVAHGDLPAIVNTEIAALMPMPAPADWAFFKRPANNNAANTAFEKVSIGFRRARVYVRGFANLGSLILQYNNQPPPTAPKDGAAPEIPDYMMTRVYGCPTLELATDLDCVYHTIAAQGQIGTIKSLNPWSALTSYVIGKILLNGFDGLFYRSLTGAGNLNKRPDLFVGTFWELYPATNRYQVVTELRAPLAEENIMFSSGNNTQILANGNDTALTKKQLMFIRISYVNDDWVEGPLSDARVVAGANFSDDLGDRMYRGKLMQTITSENGVTRTTWGSGRS